jgi:hypothetical protein
MKLRDVSGGPGKTSGTSLSSLAESDRKFFISGCSIVSETPSNRE